MALHRAVHLARANSSTKVLLTTFAKSLANALRSKLASLVANEPLVSARIIVKAVSAVGYELHTERFGQPQIASAALLDSLITKASAEVEGHGFSKQFLIGEWADVVDAWQLRSWQDYRDVSRLGRKTRIGGKHRETLWTIFERVHSGLRDRGVVTWSEVFGRLADSFGQGSTHPYDFSVIDEAQDLGVTEASCFAAIASRRSDGLFFAGDLGQRIFQ